MNKQTKKRRLLPAPPRVKFPGGHVQIINPRYPIEGVWSDILVLKPNRELPAHVHNDTSSLLICVNGVGEAGVNKKRIRLRAGISVFIPAGARHYVKSGKSRSLTCLSINEGIVKPGAGTDLVFSEKQSAATRNDWEDFMDVCASASVQLRKEMKKNRNKWSSFSLDVK